MTLSYFHAGIGVALVAAYMYRERLFAACRPTPGADPPTMIGAPVDPGIDGVLRSAVRAAKAAAAQRHEDDMVRQLAEIAVKASTPLMTHGLAPASMHPAAALGDKADAPK